MKPELDGADKAIVQTWETGIGGYAFKVIEHISRARVQFWLNQSSATASLSELEAVIRILQLARDRLEVFGTMAAMEKATNP